METLKKIFSLLLALVMMVTMVPVRVLAMKDTDAVELTPDVVEELHYTEEYTVGDYRVGLLRLDGPHVAVSIVGYYGAVQDLVIPSYIDGYPVVRIEGGAFSFNENIQSVTIPESVLVMGVYPYGAFSNCINLTSVKLPESLEKIDPWTFACTGLTNVEIPDQVKTIGYGAFANCSLLNSVKLPAGLKDIEGYAFDECISLTELTLPEGLKSIGEGAFRLSGITSLEVPDSVTTMEPCIYGSAIKHFKWPSGVNVVPSGWFVGCEALESVVFSEGVTEIADDDPTDGKGTTFQNCTNLTSVTFPESLEKIGSWAFGDTGLTSVQIPDQVKTIGYGAFANCSSLNAVNLPVGLKYIDGYVFADCHSLTELMLPEGLESIGEHAFSWTGITSLEIPDSVNAIADNAFCYCGKLSVINFKGNAPEIKEHAFSEVTANAYYPASNPTWTKDVRKDYGGKITWVSVETQQIGDTNGDGRINAKDATLILQYSVGMLKDNVNFDLSYADVNKDGKINAKDSTLILQYSVGIRTDFPGQK